MGNEITRKVKTGTLGELLVQLRLLQFGVQAAPPIKDSGNDLIAIRGENFRGIQVKTTEKPRFGRRPKLPNRYHILALVRLKTSGAELLLDQSEVFLVPRAAMDVAEGSIPGDLDGFRISESHINSLFPLDQDDRTDS